MDGSEKQDDRLFWCKFSIRNYWLIFSKITTIEFNHYFCYDTTIKGNEVFLWRMC